MRIDICEMLADGWRIAENIYLENGDSSMKDYMYRVQKSFKLTEEETEEMESLGNSMGV